MKNTVDIQYLIRRILTKINILTESRWRPSISVNVGKKQSFVEIISHKIVSIQPSLS